MLFIRVRCHKNLDIRLSKSHSILCFCVRVRIHSFASTHSHPLIRIHSFASTHSHPLIRVHSFASTHSRPLIRIHSFASTHSHPLIRIHSFASTHSRPLIRIHSFASIRKRKSLVHSLYLVLYFGTLLSNLRSCLCNFHDQ
jgi:hypothetical protein